MFITLLFVLPGPKEMAIPIPYLDKVVHFCLHGLFVFLWLRCFFKKRSTINISIILVVLCMGYGIAIEVVQQHYIENRSGNVWDVFANMLGTLSGWFVFRKSLKTEYPQRKA